MQKGPAIFVILVALLALGLFSYNRYKHYFPSQPDRPANAQGLPPGMSAPVGMSQPPAPAKK